MSTDFKDYYAILDVKRDASALEIKNAFRKLARMYHPDVAKDKVSADNKFKEVNEANEVLSDPDKRRKYDELVEQRSRPDYKTAPHGGGFRNGDEEGYEFHFEGTGFSDFFEQFFGSRGRPAGEFGGTRPRGGRGHARARRGQDIEGDILTTLDEVLHGSTRTIKLQRTDARTGQTSTQTLQVKIPPGVREAQLIRLAGQGQEGFAGGDSGHLYLRVKFAQHPEFRVQRSDLYYDLELAPWEAVLGAHVDMPSLDGSISLKVPPGTLAGRQFRLRQKGLPVSADTRGDLYATVSIAVPPKVTNKEKALWEQLAQTSPFNPRKST